MTEFDVRNPAFQKTVRGFLEAMPAFGTLGLSIGDLAPGRAVIDMAVRPPVTFDGRHVQGGIVGALLDIAGGAAAFTLAPAGHGIATTGFDTHHLAPAAGRWLRAEARVVKPGRNQTLCLVEIFAESGGDAVPCATGHVTSRWTPLPPDG
jgi:uncharacterized protein (TIGR00369 family)